MDTLQLFLAAANSKIKQSEHEEKFSKVEQYSVCPLQLYATSASILARPLQYVVHHAVREAESWVTSTPGQLCWSSPLSLMVLLWQAAGHHTSAHSFSPGRVGEIIRKVKAR